MLALDVHILLIVLRKPDKHLIHCNNFVIRWILFEWFVAASSRVAIAMIFGLFRLFSVITTMMVIREPEIENNKKKQELLNEHSNSNYVVWTYKKHCNKAAKRK